MLKTKATACVRKVRNRKCSSLLTQLRVSRIQKPWQGDWHHKCKKSLLMRLSAILVPCREIQFGTKVHPKTPCVVAGKMEAGRLYTCFQKLMASDWVFCGTKWLKALMWLPEGGSKDTTSISFCRCQLSSRVITLGKLKMMCFPQRSL